MRINQVALLQKKDKTHRRRWCGRTAIVICAGLVVLAGMMPCRADVVQRLDGGTINWTQGNLSATGAVDPEQNNQRQADCQKVLAAAKMKAQQQLLETAKSVRIDGEQHVLDVVEKSDGVMPKLMDMVKSADIYKQEYLTNGAADVGVRMSLYGGFSQLVLPPEIEHVEPVKPVSKTDAPKNFSSPEPPVRPEKGVYTGLIVDARGLDIDFVMTPKIFDENLQEVYGPAFVSRETAVQKGMCRYEDNMACAKNHPNSGPHPLTVKGLRVRNGRGSDIIICNGDAQKLMSASEHLAFLRQCNVIILVDTPASGGETAD